MSPKEQVEAVRKLVDQDVTHRVTAAHREIAGWDISDEHKGRCFYSYLLAMAERMIHFEAGHYMKGVPHVDDAGRFKHGRAIESARAVLNALCDRYGYTENGEPIQ